jgi:hypothetical protein
MARLMRGILAPINWVGMQAAADHKLDHISE